MNKRGFRFVTFRKTVLAAGVLMLISVAAAPVISAEGIIDPEADKILRPMSSYPGETKAFSMNADIDFEIITKGGQKLQLSSFATVLVDRPEKFHIQCRR